MKSVLEERLSNKISELKKQKVAGQKILNSIKEELHLIILNFLYSHQTYQNCVMYGGSALRIVYDLPRMSVDLDFQINFPLNKERFEKELKDHFIKDYGYKKLGVNHTTSQEKDTQVFWVTFDGLDKFKIPGIPFTKLKVRLDFNYFETDNFEQIIVPIKNEDNEFGLRTYPQSTLMASKLVALLNRVQYSVPDAVGKTVTANYKGRDIFDTIWYLQKGIIPNLVYLEKKGLSNNNYPELFKKIKERLSNLGDAGRALRADLTHLYFQPAKLDEWMNRWDILFLDSYRNYVFVKVGALKYIRVMQNFETDNFTFKYSFETGLNKDAVFVVVVSEEYLEDFPIKGFERDDLIVQMAAEIDKKDEETVKEYSGLFYSKIETFLDKIDHISPKQRIKTKLIQYSYGGYDPETAIVFTDKELEECEFEDLL